MKVVIDGKLVNGGSGSGGGGSTAAAVRYDVATTSSTTLLDRTVNTYTGSSSSVTFTLPSFQDNPGKAIDLIVDINNYSNSNDLSVDFSGYGIDFWLATTDEDISVPLTIEYGKYVRCYITQTSFKVLTDPDSLPVLQISTQEVFIPTPGLETVVTFTDDSVQVINTSGTLDTQALIDAGIYE